MGANGALDIIKGYERITHSRLFASCHRRLKLAFGRALRVGHWRITGRAGSFGFARYLPACGPCGNLHGCYAQIRLQNMRRTGFCNNVENAGFKNQNAAQKELRFDFRLSARICCRLQNTNKARGHKSYLTLHIWRRSRFL